MPTSRLPLRVMSGFLVLLQPLSMFVARITTKDRLDVHGLCPWAVLPLGAVLI